jgi:hypothetical protein
MAYIYVVLARATKCLACDRNLGFVSITFVRRDKRWYVGISIYFYYNIFGQKWVGPFSTWCTPNRGRKYLEAT